MGRLRAWTETNTELDVRIAERLTDLERHLARLHPRDPLARAIDAAEQTLGMTPYPSQRRTACVLLEGGIAELGTGEGKTLAIACAAAALAESGPVHIVTANDYLAARDASWMAPLYNALGLSVGVVRPGERPRPADVLYATLTDLMIWYLRDGLAMTPEAQVRLDAPTIIIDEADHVLLDAAGSATSILGPALDQGAQWRQVTDVARTLVRDTDFQCDEDAESVMVLPPGLSALARACDVADVTSYDHLHLVHMLTQALVVREFYARDRQYIVEDDTILPLDAITGRVLYDRTWNNGLLQALQAHEGVAISNDHFPLVSISAAAFLRRYRHRAGTSGTAWDDREEFLSSYGMDVVRIAPHRPCRRIDHPDRIFATDDLRRAALVVDVAARHERGQPVLIGATTGTRARLLHDDLAAAGVMSTTITADDHGQEAAILAHAGEAHAVTIVTSMAGRGVDILLDEPARAAGGLCVIGCERNDVARRDGQLRGRAGRQGDPGESVFFLAAEDSLLRALGERMEGLTARLAQGADEGVSLTVLSRGLDRVQRARTARERQSRQALVKIDSIVEAQRTLWRSERDRLLLGGQPAEMVAHLAAVLVVAPQGMTHDTTSAWHEVAAACTECATETTSEADAARIRAEAIMSWWRAARQEGGVAWEDLTRWMILARGDERFAEHLEASSSARLALRNTFGRTTPLADYVRDMDRCFRDFEAALARDVFSLLAQIEADER